MLLFDNPVSLSPSPARLFIMTHYYKILTRLQIDNFNSQTSAFLLNLKIIALGLSKSLKICRNFPVWGRTRVTFCSTSEVYDVFPSIHLSNKFEGDGIEENEEFELLVKISQFPLYL
ncbi:hypothetical protein DVH24_037692 [Malus domestica]|uniref:Uncharacterized protein n=1 Tax=Malus domestica TaxID=3750 RepID=A0A498J0I6_MALDO|nr:hypothetical protein DVH24_037692 [Malus domestica]